MQRYVARALGVVAWFAYKTFYTHAHARAIPERHLFWRESQPRPLPRVRQNGACTHRPAHDCPNPDTGPCPTACDKTGVLTFEDNPITGPKTTVRNWREIVVEPRSLECQPATCAKGFFLEEFHGATLPTMFCKHDSRLNRGVCPKQKRCTSTCHASCCAAH